MLLVPLLLATTMVPASQVPEAEPKSSAGQTQEEVPAPTGEGAQEQKKKAQAQTEPGVQLISGMSILGNQEAPKSLVIVPWKSSEIGDFLAISTMLDDSRQPVDREVFLRALSYYKIRSERTP
jgi:hypothetical protein